MKRNWRIGAAGLTAGLFLIGPAWAVEGNPEAGKIAASTCMGCHGIKDYSMPYPTYHVPRIGGQHATYISNALKGYANGDRHFPTMHAQAASLSEQDIADIAAYLSTVPKQ